jgi:serine phosphatase RsbU (regulator of sigma subunit)
VLLDHSLPDESGIQFLSELHNGSAKPALPSVILMLGDGNEATAAEAMRLGAADFMIKSQVTAAGLWRRVRKAVADVKRRRRGYEASRKLTLAKAQLHAAGEVQRMLFPQRSPTVPGLEIAGLCFPAEASGGDFYDYPCMIDGSIGIVVGDVSGHGLGPAILAADCRAYLRALARSYDSPGKVLLEANQLLCDDIQGERFVTLFFACLHPETGRIRIASAGHRGYFFDRHGVVTTLDSQQPPLGIAPEFIREYDCQLMFPRGGMLLLMTDGITEAAATRSVPRSAATMFGERRALDFVRDCRHDRAARIAAQLIDRAREFTDRRAQDDDMTVVVVKVLDC